jgi:hypothetical protein
LSLKKLKGKDVAYKLIMSPLKQTGQLKID